MFGHIPEELQVRMQEAHDHHVAHIMDFQHSIEEVWQSLTAEQQYTIAGWFNYLANSSADQVRCNLSYTAGSLYRLSAQGSSKCIVCDKNHDEEIEGLLPPATDQVAPEHEHHTHVKTQSSEQDAAAAAAYEESQRIIAEHEANVEKWGLVQDFEKGGFKCASCGMPYPSLEDRMLKPPGIDGCHGCQQKSATG